MPRLDTVIPPVPEAPLKRPGLRNDKYIVYYRNYLINYVFCISPLRKLFKRPCLRRMPRERGYIQGLEVYCRAHAPEDMPWGICPRGYTLGDMLWGHVLEDMPWGIYPRGYALGDMF